MKKIVIATSILGTLAFASLADTTHLNVNVGANKFKTANTGGAIGVSIGAKKIIGDNLMLGGSIGADVFKTKTKHNGSATSYVLDVLPSITYRVGDFSVDGILGYSWGGVEKNGTSHFKGLTYGTSLNYHFSKEFGVGLNYKRTDAKFTKNIEDTKLDRYSLGLNWSY